MKTLQEGKHEFTFEDVQIGVELLTEKVRSRRHSRALPTVWREWSLIRDRNGEQTQRKKMSVTSQFAYRSPLGKKLSSPLLSQHSQSRESIVTYDRSDAGDVASPLAYGYVLVLAGCHPRYFHRGPHVPPPLLLPAMLLPPQEPRVHPRPRSRRRSPWQQTRLRAMTASWVCVCVTAGARLRSSVVVCTAWVGVMLYACARIKCVCGKLSAGSVTYSLRVCVSMCVHICRSVCDRGDFPAAGCEW